MDLEYIKEPKDGLVKYDPETIAFIRKEFNINNKQNREKAIALIQEWVKQQDHFIKKDFSKGYIERCIVTCKGSLEKTKKQIDRMCTLRTLIPSYFQITNFWDSELADFVDRGEVAILPKLTDDYYRVVIVKAKPNYAIKSSNEILMFFKFIVFIAEYLKSKEYCRGFLIIEDIYDIEISDYLTKVNLIDLQQTLRILTDGYGCRIKGIFMVTSSKFIKSFIKFVKPICSEKVAKRIHAVTCRKSLPDLIQANVLPEDYGGTEASIKQLYENLIEALTSPPVQELMKEMNAAKTDESKRKLNKFNEEYLGMPGTFRNLSVD